MVIEPLALYYHIECFRCCVCYAPLGTGERGTDVRVRASRLHCQNCYSSDEGITVLGQFFLTVVVLVPHTATRWHPVCR